MVYKANRFKWGIRHRSVKRPHLPGDVSSILVAVLHRSDMPEGDGQGRHLPVSSLQGPALVVHSLRGIRHTHHGGFSISVGFAPKVSVWLKPQPHQHGSKVAPGARAMTAAAAACLGQGLAPPKGLLHPGMGAGQAPALRGLKLLWLWPPVPPGKLACNAWFAEPAAY